MRRRVQGLTLWALAVAAGPSGAGAQPAVQAPRAESVEDSTAKTTGARARDPHRAYKDGHYDQALQKFLDQQVEHPDDPEVAMSVASAHYKMNNWAEAEKAFHNAALRGDVTLRARAMYNLGNVAYRQGKLDQAIAHYQATLDLDPNDEDAKFNLEFVRNELRRRMEEAEKRQQEPPQQGQPNQEQQGQGSEPEPQNAPAGEDRAHDRPQEQKPETGAGEPDKRDQAQAPAAQAAQGQGQQMSKEQAEQALRAIDETRPQNPRRAAGRRAQPQKDW